LSDPVESCFDELEPVAPGSVDAALQDDPGITDVALVHGETGTGILNRLGAVAEVRARRGRRLIVDAMSLFGAPPIDARRSGCIGAIGLPQIGPTPAAVAATPDAMGIVLRPRARQDGRR
jgi:aspartate aminotransferase-like enzyme